MVWFLPSFAKSGVSFLVGCMLIFTNSTLLFVFCFRSGFQLLAKSKRPLTKLTRQSFHGALYSKSEVSRHFIGCQKITIFAQNLKLIFFIILFQNLIFNQMVISEFSCDVRVSVSDTHIRQRPLTKNAIIFNCKTVPTWLEHPLY